jgi:hypothetical protein
MTVPMPMLVPSQQFRYCVTVQNLHYHHLHALTAAESPEEYSNVLHLLKAAHPRAARWCPSLPKFKRVAVQGLPHLYLRSNPLAATKTTGRMRAPVLSSGGSLLLIVDRRCSVPNVPYHNLHFIPIYAGFTRQRLARLRAVQRSHGRGGHLRNIGGA